MLSGKSKNIIIGLDKTQLLYATSNFMRQQSPGIQNIYLSKIEKHCQKDSLFLSSSRLSVWSISLISQSSSPLWFTSSKITVK